ncbi:Pentatricopeptide repeat-containing protein [Cynara cardunculus var. scolymus]|uniref:Pentatricopeptide repeat-containing protein n=1 Tax=Cynara cardunculus var. scolymus TaxID=59895 RepID=A0A103YDR2_CYNCS|nr:Pentatricopeptide repeat-containing protein [Cynara cardunculus var. scolymus]
MELDPRRIHARVIKTNTAGASQYRFQLNNLITLYFKSHLVAEAVHVFQQIPSPNVVSWTSLISGHSNTHFGLSYFVSMLRHPILPNQHYSVSAALRASAELASLEQCRVVHAHSIVNGLDSNVIVGTALVDGYGKCGMVDEGRLVFDQLLSILNLIGWNAMLSSYAQQGDKDSVTELFSIMEYRGLVPDQYSFLSVMTAFCNAGLADETERWFRKMELEYKLEPWIEHYTCLVGALGRAGKLEEAKKIAFTMPIHKPDAAIWRALLSTSAHHGNIEMAKEMSQKLQELDPQDDSAYVIAANAFSGAGKLEDVQEVRKLMKDRRVKKEGGLSWIEVCGQVHVFLAGDRRHEKTEEIYAKLAELMEKISKLGYVPVWDEMLHEVGKGEKREALWHHSEKLAVAFGLVSGAAPPGKTVRIVKNLRICKDCHEAFKYISRVVERRVKYNLFSLSTFISGSRSGSDGITEGGNKGNY